MKKSAFLWQCLALFACGTFAIQSQENEEIMASVWAEKAEDGPIMFKFEPDYLLSIADRKARIRITRAILDSMDISEGKRRRLLKDLYKYGLTNRLLDAIKSDATLTKVAY